MRASVTSRMPDKELLVTTVLGDMRRSVSVLEYGKSYNDFDVCLAQIYSIRNDAFKDQDTRKEEIERYAKEIEDLVKRGENPQVFIGIEINKLLGETFNDEVTKGIVVAQVLQKSRGLGTQGKPMPKYEKRYNDFDVELAGIYNILNGESVDREVQIEACEKRIKELKAKGQEPLAFASEKMNSLLVGIASLKVKRVDDVVVGRIMDVNLYPSNIAIGCEATIKVLKEIKSRLDDSVVPRIDGIIDRYRVMKEVLEGGSLRPVVTELMEENFKDFDILYRSLGEAVLTSLGLAFGDLAIRQEAEKKVLTFLKEEINPIYEESIKNEGRAFNSALSTVAELCDPNVQVINGLHDSAAKPEDAARRSILLYAALDKNYDLVSQLLKNPEKIDFTIQENIDALGVLIGSGNLEIIKEVQEIIARKDIKINISGVGVDRYENQRRNTDFKLLHPTSGKSLLFAAAMASKAAPENDGTAQALVLALSEKENHRFSKEELVEIFSNCWPGDVKIIAANLIQHRESGFFARLRGGKKYSAEFIDEAKKEATVAKVPARSEVSLRTFNDTEKDEQLFSSIRSGDSVGFVRLAREFGITKITEELYVRALKEATSQFVEYRRRNGRDLSFVIDVLRNNFGGKDCKSADVLAALIEYHGVREGWNYRIDVNINLEPEISSLLEDSAITSSSGLVNKILKIAIDPVSGAFYEIAKKSLKSLVSKDGVSFDDKEALNFTLRDRYGLERVPQEVGLKLIENTTGNIQDSLKTMMDVLKEDFKTKEHSLGRRDYSTERDGRAKHDRRIKNSDVSIKKLLSYVEAAYKKESIVLDESAAGKLVTYAHSVDNRSLINLLVEKGVYKRTLSDVTFELRKDLSKKWNKAPFLERSFENLKQVIGDEKYSAWSRANMTPYDEGNIHAICVDAMSHGHPLIVGFLLERGLVTEKTFEQIITKEAGKSLRILVNELARANVGQEIRTMRGDDQRAIKFLLDRVPDGSSKSEIVEQLRKAYPDFVEKALGIAVPVAAEAAVAAEAEVSEPSAPELVPISEEQSAVQQDSDIEIYGDGGSVMSDMDLAEDQAGLDDVVLASDDQDVDNVASTSDDELTDEDVSDLEVIEDLETNLGLTSDESLSLEDDHVPPQEDAVVVAPTESAAVVTPIPAPPPLAPEFIGREQSAAQQEIYGDERSIASEADLAEGRDEAGDNLSTGPAVEERIAPDQINVEDVLGAIYGGNRADLAYFFQHKPEVVSEVFDEFNVRGVNDLRRLNDGIRMVKSIENTRFWQSPVSKIKGLVEHFKEDTRFVDLLSELQGAQDRRGRMEILGRIKSLMLELVEDVEKKLNLVVEVGVGSTLTAQQKDFRQTKDLDEKSKRIIHFRGGLGIIDAINRGDLSFEKGLADLVEHFKDYKEGTYLSLMKTKEQLSQFDKSISKVVDNLEQEFRNVVQSRRDARDKEKSELQAAAGKKDDGDKDSEFFVGVTASAVVGSNLEKAMEQIAAEKEEGTVQKDQETKKSASVDANLAVENVRQQDSNEFVNTGDLDPFEDGYLMDSVLKSSTPPKPELTASQVESKVILPEAIEVTSQNSAQEDLDVDDFKTLSFRAGSPESRTSSLTEVSDPFDFIPFDSGWMEDLKPSSLRANSSENDDSSVSTVDTDLNDDAEVAPEMISLSGSSLSRSGSESSLPDLDDGLTLGESPLSPPVSPEPVSAELVADLGLVREEEGKYSITSTKMVDGAEDAEVVRLNEGFAMKFKRAGLVSAIGGKDKGLQGSSIVQQILTDRQIAVASKAGDALQEFLLPILQNSDDKRVSPELREHIRQNFCSVDAPNSNSIDSNIFVTPGFCESVISPIIKIAYEVAQAKNGLTAIRVKAGATSEEIKEAQLAKAKEVSAAVEEKLKDSSETRFTAKDVLTIARKYSADYQRIAKEAESFSGRTQNARTDRDVGLRFGNSQLGAIEKGVEMAFSPKTSSERGQENSGSGFSR